MATIIGARSETNIILRTISTGARFEFPSLPAEITVKNGANYQSYKIIGIGNVKIPRGTSCEEISWEGCFYGPSKQGEAMMKTYQEPKSCVSILESLRDAGTPLTLMATAVGINRDVTISNFQWKPYGGHGNIRYSIVFSKWRDLKVKVLVNAITMLESTNTTVPPANTEDTPLPRAEAPAGQNYTETYTVVAGDTLWAIAQRKLGNGTRWTEIYNTNKSTIEAAAVANGKPNSSNGNYIWPGTVLTMPA